MGRRSRKRGGGQEEPQAGSEPAAGSTASGSRRAEPRASRRARLEEAPRPPWAPVPVTEICILGGAVLLVVGLLGSGQSRGLLLGFGFALVFLATIELALREHLAGYRSHSVLVGGCAAALVLGLTALLTGLPRPALVALAVIVFALVFTVMRSIFKNRAGGMSWRA